VCVHATASVVEPTSVPQTLVIGSSVPTARRLEASTVGDVPRAWAQAGCTPERLRSDWRVTEPVVARWRARRHVHSSTRRLVVEAQHRLRHGCGASQRREWPILRSSVRAAGTRYAARRASLMSAVLRPAPCGAKAPRCLHRIQRQHLVLTGIHRSGDALQTYVIGA